jgi:hypothetical protein
MQNIPNDNLETYLYDALSNAGSAPPPDMWARIEAELPDAAELALCATLRDAAMTAPDAAWDNIAARMDAINNADTEIDTIFSALNAYEVTPNAEIWNSIEPLLPVEKLEDISFAALANHEIAPSEGLWNKIETQLDAQFDLENDDDLQPFAALRIAEIAPTTDFWAAMEARLAEEDELVQFNALADHEVQPAADLWSRIELPAENTDVFAQFDALANHTVQPEPQNWDKIAARLEEDDDSIGMLTNRLRHAENTPNPKIWSRVSQDLPLNPALRRHLTNFSRIAAVLLVAFTASVFYNNWNNGTEDAPIALDNNKTNKTTQLAENSAGNSTENELNQPKTTRRGGKNTGNKGANATDIDINNPNIGVATSEKARFAQAETIKSQRALEGSSQSAIPTKNTNIVSKSVNKSRKGGVINNLQLELPFSKPILNDNTDNSVATTTKKNVNNVNTIEPLSPSNLTKSTIDIADNTKTIEQLPQIVMSAEMRQQIIDEIKGRPSVGFANSGLEFQYTSKELNSVWADAPTKASQSSSENINSTKNDNPVELLINQQGWSVGANVQGVAPSIFNNRIINTLTPAGGEITQAVSFRLGYGAAVGYQFNKRESVGLEYNYTQQGQTYVQAAAGRNTALPLFADYHHIVALYNKQLPLPTNQFGWDFTAGAQYGILKETSFSSPSENKIDISYIAKNDIGVVGGVGVNWFLSRQTILSLGVRATYSRDTNQFLAPDAVSNFTTALRFGATYRLNKE